MLEFRVLGPVEALRNGRRLTLPGPRGRSVLAALLLGEGAVCSVGRLTEVLWGEAPPATAVAQVQIVISRLRAALRGGPGGDPLLITAAPGYRLRLDAATLDLAEFRRHCRRALTAAERGDWSGAAAEYDRAQRHWRGEACQNVRSAALERMAARLTDEHVSAIEQQAAAALLAGHADEVVDISNRGLARHPLSERLHQLLVLAHARAGRTGAALRAFRQARNTLDAELGIAPGVELAQAELDTLRATTARSLDLVRGWFPNAAPVPIERAARPVCQLPADLADFVGRDAELRRLRGLLTGSRVVSLCGMAGVGKTTLAVRTARTMLDAFPDGCLYVELRGTGGEPRHPFEALGSLLRSLGVPSAAVPSDLDGRQALFRSVTAERRILVVVDDAWDEQQARPLVPGSPTAAVLATSRRPLSALDNVTVMRLDVAPVDDALRLLGRAIGEVDATADPDALRIVAVCGRLPLAIRLAAARLGQRDSTGLAWLADRLVDEQRRLDELAVGDRGVRSSLAASYHRLPAEAARLLRVLAVLPPRPLPTWLVGVALGGPVAVAERLLDVLLELQFVQLSPAAPGRDPRYRMHDLVRLFAVEQCQATDRPADRRRVRERVLRQLALLAAAADARLPGRQYPTPPMSLEAAARRIGQPEFLDTDYDLLASAVRQACDLDWPEYAWRLASCGVNNAERRGLAGEWRLVVSAALDCVRRCGAAPAGRAALLLADGMLNRLLGESGRALPSLRAARRHYRRLGDALRAAVTGNELAVVYRITGRDAVARAAFDWTIRQFRLAGSPPQEAWLHLALGNFAVEHDTDPAEALRCYARAEAGFRDTNDHRGLANTLGCRGSLLMRLDRLTDAAEQLQTARATFAEHDDPTNHAVAGYTLAIVYRRAGRLDEAYRLATEAMATLTNLHNVSGTARARNICAATLVDMGHPQAAVDHLAECVATFRRLRMPVALATALFDLARAHDALGERERSRQYAAESYALYRQHGDGHAADVARWLAVEAGAAGVAVG